jgi:hypothetical protein
MQPIANTSNGLTFDVNCLAFILLLSCEPVANISRNISDTFGRDVNLSTTWVLCI